MKTRKTIMVMFFMLIFLPTQIFSSGMVPRSSVCGFVFVSDYVGMKISGGTQRMIDNAQEANESRLKELQERVDSIAKDVRAALEKYAKSSKSKIEFDPIQKGYFLSERDMAEHKKYPTISLEKDAEKYVGKKCNILVTKRPEVVLRFSKLPDLKQLDLIKKIVEKYSKKKD